MAQGSQATPVLQIVVRGRIDRVTQRDANGAKSFRTLIKTPAPDAYSSPGTFELRSARRLGGTGEEVEVLCNLRGYSRSYDNKDGDKVQTAEHVLEVAA